MNSSGHRVTDRGKAETELTNYPRLKNPAISEVHLHLTAQRPLRSDREHIADDEHSDHEHWINRGSTNLRITAREFGMDPRQIQNRRDRAHQVIVRHHLVEAK